MIYQKVKPTDLSDYIDSQITHRVDVTDLTDSQRRQIFILRMNQNGFIGFAKQNENQQTYYTFHYRDHT